MAILAADIKFFLSGIGGTPDTSLGGAINATEIVDATLNNLFDVVSSAETTAGDTEYRCLYTKNNHGTLTLQSAFAFINAQTPSPDTSIEVAIGTSTVNGVEQTIADESTEPVGVSWEALTGEINPLPIGDMPAGEHQAIWIKRIVALGSSAYNNDSGIIEVKGDTAA